MKKTFTDDDGNKYELQDMGPLAFDKSTGLQVIKAIPVVEEKQRYTLELHQNFPDDQVFETEIDLTVPQAKALAEAIKALVELIQGDTHDWIDFEDGRHDGWALIRQAREAFHDN
jgi:hypothetical protein